MRRRAWNAAKAVGFAALPPLTLAPASMPLTQPISQPLGDVGLRASTPRPDTSSAAQKVSLPQAPAPTAKLADCAPEVGLIISLGQAPPGSRMSDVLH
jgi:hypothetical protein